MRGGGGYKKAKTNPPPQKKPTTTKPKKRKTVISTVQTYYRMNYSFILIFKMFGLKSGHAKKKNDNNFLMFCGNRMDINLISVFTLKS